MLSFLCILCGIAFIVVGRIKSFHLTEGEALIQYWWCWLLAIGFFVLAFLDQCRADRIKAVGGCDE